MAGARARPTTEGGSNPLSRSNTGQKVEKASGLNVVPYLVERGARRVLLCVGPSDLRAFQLFPGYVAIVPHLLPRA